MMTSIWIDYYSYQGRTQDFLTGGAVLLEKNLTGGRSAQNFLLVKTVFSGFLTGVVFFTLL